MIAGRPRIRIQRMQGDQAVGKELRILPTLWDIDLVQGVCWFAFGMKSSRGRKCRYEAWLLSTIDNYMWPGFTYRIEFQLTGKRVGANQTFACLAQLAGPPTGLIKVHRRPAIVGLRWSFTLVPVAAQKMIEVQPMNRLQIIEPPRRIVSITST